MERNLIILLISLSIILGLYTGLYKRKISYAPSSAYQKPISEIYRYILISLAIFCIYFYNTKKAT